MTIENEMAGLSETVVTPFGESWPISPTDPPTHPTRGGRRVGGTDDDCLFTGTVSGPRGTLDLGTRETRVSGDYTPNAKKFRALDAISSSDESPLSTQSPLLTN